MTLAVVATYSDLQEARIAAGALRAAGLEPFVLEEAIGSTNWLLSVAIGGYRLAVPQSQRQDAADLLASILSDAPAPSRRRDSRTWSWRVVAVGLGLVDPGLGFLAVPFRRKRRAKGIGPLLAGLAVLVVVHILLIAAVFLIDVVVNLATHPP